MLFCVDRGARADAPSTAPLEFTQTNLEQAIDPLVRDWIGDRKAAGAVVVVATRDRVFLAKGYGRASANPKGPLTADATLIRPGSISKLFTAIAVMQLVDQGKLDLDRDVNDYLDFPVPTPEGGVPVTLRRLLRHRAGFEEHVKNLFSRDPVPTALGLWLRRALPQRIFPNGDVTAYSNYGFALAGYVVERASGESFPDYVRRRILAPLGMTRSTFRQPPPAELAAMMAEAFGAQDHPLGYFETVFPSPAGALSATGADMGRFMQALLNGGALDGARILPRGRLDEMTSLQGDQTEAGYLGLAFMAYTEQGYDTIGHAGGTMAFSSNLRLFPEQGFGVFVSFDGIGGAKPPPSIPRAIAEKFLPTPPATAPTPAAKFADDPRIEGVWRTTRRAETTFVKVAELFSQRYVRSDGRGGLAVAPAIWPFGQRRAMNRLGQDLYQFPSEFRVALEDRGEAGVRLVGPGMEFQRASWSEDARVVGPGLLASVVTLTASLLTQAARALLRPRSATPPIQSAKDRRIDLAARCVVVVDAVVIVMATALFVMSADLSIFNERLDPLILMEYGLAWLGAAGAPLVAWRALDVWRNPAANLLTRAHHAALAASAGFLAWFFVAFHVAGTTLNY
jgi:CubicO group peptidase (beta-lactamase class C family)